MKYTIEERPDIGRPTAASVEKYILLPATERFMVIVFPRKAGGLFSKKNKFVLSVCDTPKGAEMEIFRSIHSHNVFFGAWKIGTTMSMEEERKGRAEETLQKYVLHMREILSAAGYALCRKRRCRKRAFSRWKAEKAPESAWILRPGKINKGIFIYQKAKICWNRSDDMVQS